jgi:Dyp-type peroxidase family
MKIKKRLQDGIYFQRNQFSTSYENNTNPKNDCFAIVFLRIGDGLKSSQTIECLHSLWQTFLNLQKGIVNDLPGALVRSGDLSILLGYGPNIFKIPGVIKKIPRDFLGKQFREPICGEPILDGSGIKYVSDSPRNLGITEHLAIQFISKSQVATYRAVVETWKFLARIEPSKKVVNFTTFFTGFQRDDGRSWLGFHDEVSNMASPLERKKAIVIDNRSNNLVHRDYWTAGGTYLVFLRTEINLAMWEKIRRSDQEIIIGRDKLTGVPIVGIDKNGNPVIRRRSSRFSEIRSSNKRFHEHPDYFQKPSINERMESTIDVQESIRSLSQSHIGRTRHLDHIKSEDPASRRIFRQGFEFIEPVYHDSTKPLRLGLNFVSFQNDPTRLLFILTDPNWLGNTNFGGKGNIHGMRDLIRVLACGVFYVPPYEKPFPGVSIFKSECSKFFD